MLEPTPNQPIVNAGLLYMTGLGISKTAAKEVTVQLGAVRDSTNTNDIILGPTALTPDEVTTPAVPIVINGAQVGANGVDVAVLAASSLYAVFMIGDSTDHNPTAGLLSLSTTPYLPYGYDMFKRIGWIFTDGSKNILQFWQYGDGLTRDYYFDVGISVLAGGNSTVYAAVNLSTAVPPLATQVLFNVTFTAASATDVAQFLPFGSAATNGIVVFGYGSAAAQVGMATIPCQLTVGDIPEILYKVTAGGDALTLLVAGFQDIL